jgi:hypothetical protein
MLGPFQSINIPPTAAQERRAKENNDKVHQIVMPDEFLNNQETGPVILTFGGDNLCLRMNPDGTAADGSLGLYVTAMALKAQFEYQTSSPQSKIVDSELAKWTTRGWTANQKAGANYVLGITSWLKLDWLGRPAGKGSRIPGASENAYLAATEYQNIPLGDSGD